MIRDKRAFIAVNVVGATCGAFMLGLQLMHPLQHSVFPRWLNLALPILMTAGFVYNIALRLRGPIQPSRWARGLSDPQLWLLKGVLAAGVALATVLVIFRVER